MKRLILAALFAGAAFNAAATVTVKEPWVRATVAQQKATGAFMQLTTDQNTRLISAQSPVANIVEIHEMRMVEQTMKMRAISGLDVIVGKTVELKPGSYHIMLIDLKQTLKEGDIIPLTLTFEDQNKKQEVIEIKAPAKPLNSMQGNGAMMHHHGH
jgi:periplasmic copper chaperone A